MKICIKISLLSLLLSPIAQAGQESHGGSLVVCDGKAPVVLDFYHATLPTFGDPQPEIMSIEGLSTEQVIHLFRERLKGMALLKPLNEALQALGPVNHWPLKNLENVDDSNEPYHLPAHCKQVQGAIRQGRRVYLDANFGRLLAPEQLGVLAVHEALFYLSNQDTSEKVRTLIRNLMVTNTPVEALAAAIRDIGLLPYPRDELLNKIYRGVDPRFALVNARENIGLRGCSLKFNSMKIDEKLGTLVASFRHPPGSSMHDDDRYQGGKCTEQGEMTFQCSPDGKSCAVIDGEMETGWGKGCSFSMENDAHKLTFRCDGNERKYVFFRF